VPCSRISGGWPIILTIAGYRSPDRPQGWCSPVPQLKTKGSTRSSKADSPKTCAFQQPTVTDVHELIGKMMEYEDTARDRGIDLASGRFRMLTKAERQFSKAELIADYIRLAIGNLGNTPGYFDAALEAFCSKICEMEVPSLELMGTYLAAVDIVSQEERLNGIPSFNEAVRRTMIAVLQSCVAKLREGARLPAPA